MPTDLPALIARLEAASEGSRELDKEIGSALGWRYRHVDGYLQYIAGDRWDGPSGVTLGDLPRWSTSLDDALAHVVPEGWLIVGFTNGILDPKYGDVRRLTGYRIILAPEHDDVRNDPTITSRWPSACKSAPALALCIASLRALQAMSEGG